MVQDSRPDEDAAAGPPAQACPWCGNGIPPGFNLCVVCGQVLALPRGVRLASPGRRLAASLLDSLLVYPTLFIGAFVWSMIVWGRGQTPGKQLLGLRVVDASTGRVADWGRMFLRIIIFQWMVIGGLGLLTLGVVSGIGHIWLLWDQRKQNLYDKMAGTLVVYWPAHIGERARTPGPTPAA